MIPLRLEIKNFLPYRNPDPIYFEGIHLACLTGHNGAGKTSLLDAITWALWGKSRARRDEDLIHLGQKEMIVQLDFEQEGITYRVNRQRVSGKRSQGSLELFIVQDDKNLKSIREASMRETQNTINNILRLDYDTFVSSAFLQQGKADAFTTKSPSERKKILSDILGLEQWRVYEDRAKETIRGIQNNITQFEAIIRDIDETIVHEPRWLTERDNAQSDYDLAQAELDTAQEHLNRISHAEADLESAHNQIATLERTISNHKADLVTAQSDATKRQQTVGDYEQVINQATDIETGYQQLAQARQTDEALSDIITQANELERDISQVQAQITKAQTDIQADLRECDATIATLEGMAIDGVMDELAQAQVAVDELVQVETERDALNEQITEWQTYKADRNAHLGILKQVGTELNERIEQLENVETTECPLCGQTLTEDHRDQVINESKTERDDKRQEYREAQLAIQETDGEIKNGRKQLKAYATQLADLPRWRSEMGRLQEKLNQANEARDKLQALHAQRTTLQTTLEQDDFAHDLRQQLADLQAHLAELNYDDATHQEARTQLRELSAFERKHFELEKARENIDHEREMLGHIEERMRRINVAITDTQTQMTDIRAQLTELEQQVQNFRERQTEVKTLLLKVNKANERVIIAKQELNAIERHKERKLNLDSKLEEARYQEALYKELRLAFGKNGVPAMMIETAIPELETSANQLLSRMTNGRMHLRMTTQASNVDGSTRETLDIEIADELGTRAYEMYSGGESFRINFAIRVALSGLLARRAGAHLRTLFIDEGFGTQDEDGRNKLVEAITAIQDQFDLIMVITHIDELRDAFPVHVVVEKSTSSGSLVRLQ